MSRTRTAIGLMSGTSMDGIDAALIETDGIAVQRRGTFISRPYDPALRAALAKTIGGSSAAPELVDALTKAHAEIVHELVEENSLSSDQIDIIGFHGHTILHRPDMRTTIQIGDGNALARMTGIDVVNDLRAADVARGGQGAPLAPLYHAALARGLERPLAVLNIGGVANVTWIDGDDDLLAFDTGPGNALIDDWVQLHGRGLMDRDGLLAAAGAVSPTVLGTLMDNLYFDAAPPKSLDRLDFSLDPVKGLSVEDGAATLAAFTAKSVAAARRHFPHSVARWLVCGGGRHNPYLMDQLRTELAVPVDPVEAVGWRGDAIEAEAFAFLAVRSLLDLPLSVPGTTGVVAPTCGGVLHRARAA